MTSAFPFGRWLSAGRDVLLATAEENSRRWQDSASGSGSFSHDRIRSAYDSVNEQTGILAGDGGFALTIGGHTQLDGAVIASSAAAGNNRLETGTLGWSALDNRADYSSSHFGVSIGGAAGYIPVPDLGVGASGAASGTTQVALSEATIVIRDEAAQKQDLAALSRDTGAANAGAIDRIFDRQQVEERLEASRLFGQIANQIVGDVGNALMTEAAKEFAKTGNPADKAEMERWSEGGDYKLILHGLVGALQAEIGGGNVLAGGLAGAGSETLALLAQDWLSANAPEMNEGSRRAITQWVVAMGGAAAGAVVDGGGGAVTSGAATALDAERFNRQLHQTELDRIKELAGLFAQQNGITEEEAEARLIRQALWQVDAAWRLALGSEDLSARTFLADYSAPLDPDNFGENDEHRYRYFTENDPGLFRDSNHFAETLRDQKNLDLYLRAYGVPQAELDKWNSEQRRKAQTILAIAALPVAVELAPALISCLSNPVCAADLIVGEAMPSGFGAATGVAGVKALEKGLATAGNKAGITMEKQVAEAASNNAQVIFRGIEEIPKGQRPDPSRYLTPEYINSHLAQFEGGVTKIIAGRPIGTVGHESGTFVLPKSVADKAIAEAGGNVAKLERLLAMDAGSLGSNPQRVDIANPSGLRLPSGNEAGVNAQWKAGGYTSGGLPEAVIDPVSNDIYKVKNVF